jgi:hypothetical protein
MATQNTGTNIATNTGQQTSTASTLSDWAGPYVTGMLGKVEALADQPYQAYEGPLTAGQSALQSQAFSGIGGLTIPTEQMNAGYTPGTFTAGTASSYMNPYLMAALNPQLDEARRQAEILRTQQASRMAKAGAYGGGRQAIMESELGRNLMQNLSKITGEGYKSAFDQALAQFNTEQQREMAAAKQAQDYGLAALQRQADLGAVQRGIETEGIGADYKQFQEERDFPYKNLEFQRQFLANLPIASSNFGYSQPDMLSNLLGSGSGLLGFLRDIGVINQAPANRSSGTTDR